jgi:thiamine pyrophosphate-dependent acetolactate synthase large subunit-like protein
MAEWWQLMEERGTRKDKPMKPQVVAHELNKLLSDDAIVATDSGTITTWIARHLTIRGSMMFSCSGNLATMACGLPYAIAAAVACPERQVVALSATAGLTMLIGELATCVKTDQRQIVVIKNNTSGQIGSRWHSGQPGTRLATCSRSTSPPSPAVGRRGLHGGRSGAVRRGFPPRCWQPRFCLVEAVVDSNERQCRRR